MKPLSRVLTESHLPALDGLRAVAALVVVVYHAGYARVPGDLGVTAFFALSGFLITWLLLKEHDRTGTVSLRAFYLRRTLRIFPAYYAFVLSSVAADWILGHQWTGGQIATSLTYTSNYYQATHGHSGPAAHSWSLAVEEQFYLLWPALFIMLRSRGTRTLRYGIGALLATIVAWRTFLYLGINVGSHYVYNAFDTRFDSLLIGCGLAVVSQSPGAVRWLERTARNAALPLLTLAALVYSRTGISAAYHYSLGFTVDAALSALLMVQLMQLSAGRGWRWLDHPIMVWLGAISYPIYLWHTWALALAGKVTGVLPLKLLLGCLVVVALAAGSYYAIERPFLSLRKRAQRVVRAGRESVAPVAASGAGR